MKVLIISTNALGDTYISATAVICLLNQFDDAEIHFISSNNAKFIISEIGLKKNIFIDKKITQLIASIIPLRKEKYDYVFTFFPGMVNTFYFIFSRARIKAGFVNYTRVKDWYNKSQKISISGLTGSRSSYWKPNMNYMDRVKLVLKATGINTENLSKIIYKINDELNCVKNNKFVIHFYSREKERTLPNRLLKVLCNYLLKERPDKIVLIGADNDFDVELLNYIKENPIEMKTNLSIHELVNLISSAGKFIGIDSFPLHIADSYNKKFVGLFTDTKPESVLQNSSKSICFTMSSFEMINESEFLEILDKNKKLLFGNDA